MKLKCTLAMNNDVWQFTEGKVYKAFNDEDRDWFVMADNAIPLYLFRYESGIRGAGMHGYMFKEV